MNIRVPILAAVALLALSRAYAQVPQGMNYQAVARNALGAILADADIGIRVSILRGSATGEVEYVETHAVKTNAFGLFTIAVGTGIPKQGTFARIAWATGEKWMRIEMDPAGGINYIDMGSSKLLSVPYAMFAGVAEHSFVSDSSRRDGSGFVTSPSLKGDGSSRAPLELAQQGAKAGQTLKWNGSAWTPADDQGSTYSAGAGIEISNRGAISQLPHNGDVMGTTTLRVTGLQGYPVSGVPPAHGQILKWDALTDSWQLKPDNVGKYYAGPGISIDDANVISSDLWRTRGEQIYRSTGMVGIGTSNPQSTLHVVGDVRIDGALSFGSDAGKPGQVYTSNGFGVPPSWQYPTASSLNGSAWTIRGNGGTNPASDFLGTSDAQPLVIRTDGAERARVDQFGNVGIGTTIPAGKLAVAGDVSFAGNRLVDVGGTFTGYTGTSTKHGIRSDITVSGTTNAANGWETSSIFGRIVGNVSNGPYQAQLSGVYGEAVNNAPYNAGNIYGGYFNATQGNPPGGSNIVSGLSGTSVTSNTSGIVTDNWGVIGRAIASGSGGSARDIFGVYGLGAVSGNTTVSNLVGVQGSLFISNGTTTDAVGLRGGVTVFSGTVTNAYGVHIPAVTKSGGSVGTAYGLRIEQPTAGTSNYTLYSVSGVNYFGGNVGVGTATPAARVQVNSGDVYVDTIGRGVIVKSPNGGCWRITVDNNGALTTTGVACP